MRRSLAHPSRALALCGAGALLLSGCAGQGSDPAAESAAPATVTVTAEASSAAPSSSPASSEATASGSATPTAASGTAQADALPAVEAAGMTAVEKTFPVDQGQYRHEPDRGMVGGGSQQCREAVDAVRAAQDGAGSAQAVGRKYHGEAGRGGRQALMVQVTTDSPRDLEALFGDVERACADEDGRVGGPQSTFETVQLPGGGGFVSTKSPAQESARGYFAATTDAGELVMLVDGLGAEDARELFEAQLDAARG